MPALKIPSNINVTFVFVFFFLREYLFLRQQQGGHKKRDGFTIEKEVMMKEVEYLTPNLDTLIHF